MPTHTPTLAVAGSVATLALQRPLQANRLEPQDLHALAAHVAAVDADPAVRVLLLRAQGPHFSSGFHIGQMAAAHVADFEAVVERVHAARPVTIVVLQGGVYGGATDLALACDFRIGSPATALAMPAARLGLHFYRSGLERYVTRLGVDAAKRLFLTAERIDAAEMKSIGFLTHLVPAVELDACAAAVAAQVCALAPLAVQGMKRHLDRIASERLDGQALARDFAACLGSADLQEGLAAFAQKRTPRFEGR